MLLSVRMAESVGHGGRCAFAALLLLPLIASNACGECTYEHDEALFTIRKDVGCPPPSKAPHASWSDDTAEVLTATTLEAPDRTICWYRTVLENSKPCSDGPVDTGDVTMSRTYYLGRATRKEPRENLYSDQHEETVRSLLSCDADGDLYGALLRDESGGPGAAPRVGDCPAPSELNLLPASLEPIELVGSDLYPVLVVCSYLLVSHDECRVGAPPAPGS